jgi:hypothetical protein
MAAVPIVLAWFGYSVLYYGLNTVTGGNESFMSLIWPGRYAPVPRDSGGSQPPPGTLGGTLPASGGTENNPGGGPAGSQPPQGAPGSYNQDPSRVGGPLQAT